MQDYHEPIDELQPQDRNYIRALNSLKEEIEAVNWYHQRVAASNDPQLKSIMAHNRDEEIEHACMALEWLRRNMPGWDEQLKTYLFKSGDITTLEEEAESGESESGSKGSSDIGIGSLKST